MEHRVTFKIGEEELILDTGKMAKQANGAVFARLGGSAVLATACCASNEKEDLDFIPLSVDYIEKYYAAGKIPAGSSSVRAGPRTRRSSSRVSSTGPSGPCSPSSSGARSRSSPWPSPRTRSTRPTSSP